MADSNTFDAIVVGSGISGGWAAKELCEKGLKTIVLERGRKLDHVADYKTTNTPPYDFTNRGKITEQDRQDYPVQHQVYAFNEGTRDYWVKDKDHPYTTAENEPFKWIRGYHVGGRSIMWGRQCYRWSDLDFEANAKEGVGVDWPIRYKDIAPWYDYVERFAGISGQAEGLSHLPDGQFLPPMALNCVEQHLKKSIESKWADRRLTIGRVANLTKNHNGRSKCQHRNLCYRGCPYGAYFSSQSATLPAAAATGNMTLRPNSVVAEILYDDNLNRATGVRVIDAQSGEELEFKAKVVFLCASTLGSAWVLLHSTSNAFPNGLANSSGMVGRNLMDHHYRIGARAQFEGFDDQYYFGGRPNGVYIPRFRNVSDKHPGFLRGYGYQGSASRASWTRGGAMPGFGADFKASLMKPGPWELSLTGFGECLPYQDNFVQLNHDVKDVHGLPTLTISCTFRENELAMRKDMAGQAAEMLASAGAVNIEEFDIDSTPGFCIHEMGTARMGRDSKTSVLNEWNQSHDVPNLFITDGSAMASSACQNPSLTYMALTARAVDYAVKQLENKAI